MKNFYRKSAPRVKTGTVQRKNRWSVTPKYRNAGRNYPVFDKERPGAGYRHLIRKKELCRFVDIVPEWDVLSKDLDAVVLSAGAYDHLGWHNQGVIGICAWERDIVWEHCSPDFYNEHEDIFAKLNIPCRKVEDDYVIEFDERTAKAFQLIHVFLHELGHHNDRMTTRSKRSAARGESHAEEYSKKYEDIVIDRYFRMNF